MMNFKIVHIEVTDSTNRWMKEHGEGEMVVVADFQTAGKGCGQNSWESERGQNLLFSVLIHPTNVSARTQFIITQVVSVALCNTLEKFITLPVEIKWPNDIYVGDKKISGTLIECDLVGKNIANCIIGVGININQTVFRSDAPNPTSLQLLTGKEHDREAVLASLLSHFQTYYEWLAEGKEEEVRQTYWQHLYRREGMHRYHDVRGDFMAEIAEVEPTGHLCLRFEDGNVVRYEFKEVQFIKD